MKSEVKHRIGRRDLQWKKVTERAFAAGTTPEYFSASTWLVWHLPETRHAGLTVWGRVSLTDSARMFSAFQRILASERGPYSVVNDLLETRPTDFRTEVFAQNIELAKDNLANANAGLRRQAFVVPRDTAGAPWLGVNHTLEVAFEWGCFFERVEAWNFVELDGLAADALGELLGEQRSQNLSSVRVVEVLENEPNANLSRVAKVLGLSGRTLQRQLGSGENSFAALRQRVRLDRAQALVEDPDVKIESIASECGFASRAHFFRWFKRMTGSNPGQLRTTSARSEKR